VASNASRVSSTMLRAGQVAGKVARASEVDHGVDGFGCWLMLPLRL
jgi:hypothetical protein